MRRRAETKSAVQAGCRARMVKVEEAVGTTGAETDKATFLGGVYGVGKESGRHIFEKDVGQSSLEVRGSADPWSCMKFSKVWGKHLWVRRDGEKD